jgi:hypothetical protein
MSKWENPRQQRKQEQLHQLQAKMRLFDIGMLSSLGLAFVTIILNWFDYLPPIIAFPLIFMIANGLWLVLPKQQRLEKQIEELERGIK